MFITTSTRNYHQKQQIIFIVFLTFFFFKLKDRPYVFEKVTVKTLFVSLCNFSPWLVPIAASNYLLHYYNILLPALISIEKYP